MLDHGIKLFSGTSNQPLAKAICQYLGMELGVVQIEPFPDGEMFIRLEEDVRGKDCFILQSTSAPVDTNLMELLIYLDCLRRASATRITAVMPYFGYARQDRKDAGRVPITAKLVANLITTAGADRVLAVDLHAGQLQGFFDIPLDHLTAEPVLAGYIKTKKITDLTVVAPDVGNMKTASRYASILSGELAIIHKRRVSGQDVECTEIIGDVKDRNVLMCDDMISTAGTICGAGNLVRERGAKSITVGATHGILVGPAVERIAKAPFDEIVITDTIPLNETAAKLPNLKVLTVSQLLGEAIRRIHNNESISSMFNDIS
jgi:ribose-phosphate pyrophosphokinase